MVQVFAIGLQYTEREAVYLEDMGSPPEMPELSPAERAACLDELEKVLAHAALHVGPPDGEVRKSATRQLMALLQLRTQHWARERHLIDLCHRVDQGLQQLPQTPEIEALVKDLESVRLWWYPVQP